MKKKKNREVIFGIHFAHFLSGLVIKGEYNEAKLILAGLDLVLPKKVVIGSVLC